MCGAVAGGVMALGMFFGRDNPRTRATHRNAGVGSTSQRRPNLRLGMGPDFWMAKPEGNADIAKLCSLAAVNDRVLQSGRSCLFSRPIHDHTYAKKSNETADNIKAVW